MTTSIPFYYRFVWFYFFTSYFEIDDACFRYFIADYQRIKEIAFLSKFTREYINFMHTSSPIYYPLRYKYVIQEAATFYKYNYIERIVK